mgnify:CR=1 FL=1
MTCNYKSEFSKKLHERLVKNTKGFYIKNSNQCLKLDNDNIDLINGDSKVHRFDDDYTNAYRDYIEKYEQFLRDYDDAIDAIKDAKDANGPDAVAVAAAVANKKTLLKDIINGSKDGNIHKFVNSINTNIKDNFKFEGTTDSSDITATILDGSSLDNVGKDLIDHFDPLLGNGNDGIAKFKKNYKDYIAADGEYKDAYKQLKMNEQLIFAFILSSISLGLLLHYNN